MTLILLLGDNILLVDFSEYTPDSRFIKRMVVWRNNELNMERYVSDYKKMEAKKYADPNDEGSDSSSEGFF